MDIFEENDCRCPTEFPDFYTNEQGIEKKNTCTNGVSTYPRFNVSTLFNSASVLANSTEKWASSPDNNVTMLIEFELSYEVITIHLISLNRTINI